MIIRAVARLNANDEMRRLEYQLASFAFCHEKQEPLLIQTCNAKVTSALPHWKYIFERREEEWLLPDMRDIVYIQKLICERTLRQYLLHLLRDLHTQSIVQEEYRICGL